MRKRVAYKRYSAVAACVSELVCWGKEPSATTRLCVDLSSCSHRHDAEKGAFRRQRGVHGACLFGGRGGS